MVFVFLVHNPVLHISRILFAAALATSSSSGAASAKPDDDGSFKKFVYNIRAAKTPQGYQVIRGPAAFIRDGRRAFRFEVRDGGCGGADCTRGRERVARWHRAGSRPGREYRFARSFFLDPSYRGPLGFDHREDVSFRFGVYRGRADQNRARVARMPTQIVYFDNVKRGRTRAEVEAP